jgi:hypothetical protein
VVLTSDEIRPLMAALLVSDSAALGRTSLSDWLAQAGHSLGDAYANELDRHFAVAVAV